MYVMFYHVTMITDVVLTGLISATSVTGGRGLLSVHDTEHKCK